MCNPFVPVPSGHVQHTPVCAQELKQEDFLAKLLKPRKWSQSAYSGWGPVLGILCVFKSWAVCLCVCVSTKGGGAELFFPPLEGSKSRAGDSPAPPTPTWSSLGQG